MSRRRGKTHGDESEGVGTTRDRIVRAAWGIIRTEGEEAATMKAVAKAADISRQGVYLHFADRTELILAVNDYLEAKAGIDNWMREVAAEQDGAARIRRFAEIRFKRILELRELVSSVEGARYRDDAAASASRRRYEVNASWVTDLIINKLASEGKVHPSWPPRDAATMVVMMFSFHSWHVFTAHAGWDVQKYVEILSMSTLSVLAHPPTQKHARSARIAGPKLPPTTNTSASQRSANAARRRRSD